MTVFELDWAIARVAARPCPNTTKDSAVQVSSTSLLMTGPLLLVRDLSTARSDQIIEERAAFRLR